MSEIRVLVVDDEPHISMVVRTKLAAAGFDVRVASDGEEALEAVEEFRPQIVVSDFQMPIVSGFEFACELKSRGIDTPVIMVTARGHMLSKDDLSKTNIRKLLPKPFSPRQLLELVHEIIDREGIMPEAGV